MSRRKEAPLRFGEGRVEVWRIPLAGEEKREPGVLSPEELARAKRFRRDCDRRRFLAAHCGLREILSGYVGSRPEALRFRLGPYGKPELVGVETVQFSLAHSKELALVAIGEGPVGVDVEYREPGADFDEMLGEFCSRAEGAEAQGCAETALWIWTAKEAYLKARGTGFAVTPQSVRLLGRPREGAQTTVAGDEAWRIESFVAQAGYHAAVAWVGDRASPR